MGDDRHRDFLCPKLLIADEPTTGPDVTTQKVVMDLLAAIAAERGWRRS
jgi:ABC-type dipeptide/oligopeptide/nickel transport system ATPase component